MCIQFLAAAFSICAVENWNHPPDDKVAGLQHATFHSRSMNVNVGFNIYLPPDYSAQPTKRFPVIYYLHGIKGHESSYVAYARLLNDAVRAKAVRPMILVLANGGATSFFSDSPDGSVMGETVIVRELMPHVDANYRTVASGAGRALHGFSMGGSGALKLGFKYPEMFRAIVAYDALLSDAKRFRGEEKKLFTKMFGDEAGFAKNDPFELLQKNASKLQTQAIQIVVSDEEREILEGNRRLHTALERASIRHDYKEFRGVSHKKQEIFEKAALPAFQFTGRAFTGQ